MVAFTTSKSGFTSLIGISPTDAATPLLAVTLWNDLINNGFSLAATDLVSSSVITSTSMGVYLLPTSAVDPYVATNPWGVAFRVLNVGAVIPMLRTTGSITATVAMSYANTQLEMAIFNPLSFPTSAFAAEVIPGSDTLNWYPVLPGKMLNASDTTDTKNDAEFPRIWSSNPYTYNLTIVPRGFALQIMPILSSESFVLSAVMVVQRGVSCGGSVATTGYLPLFMFSNVVPYSAVGQLVQGQDIQSVSQDETKQSYLNAGPQPTWYYQVLRETDGSASYPQYRLFGGVYQSEMMLDWDAKHGMVTPVDTTLLQSNVSDNLERNGKSMHRIPITWNPNMPVTDDLGNYLLLFPSGFCTTRFAYVDEIDLIAISKASAYQSGQQVPLSVYGDSRTYSALCSNTVEYGPTASVRVFLLTNGSDFSSTP